MYWKVLSLRSWVFYRTMWVVFIYVQYSHTAVVLHTPAAGRAVLHFTLAVDTVAGVALRAGDRPPGVEPVTVVQTGGLWTKDKPLKPIKLVFNKRKY